jgi:hypothetical protein
MMEEKGGGGGFGNDGGGEGLTKITMYDNMAKMSMASNLSIIQCIKLYPFSSSILLLACQASSFDESVPLYGHEHQICVDEWVQSQSPVIGKAETCEVYVHGGWRSWTSWPCCHTLLSL